MAREGRKRRCEGLAERALPGEWGRGPRPGGGVAVGRRRSAAGLGAPFSVRPRGAAGCAGLPCGAGGCPAVRGRAPASPRSGERERRYGAAFRAPGPRGRPAGVLGEGAGDEALKCQRWGGPARAGGGGHGLCRELGRVLRMGSLAVRRWKGWGFCP